MTRLSDFGTLLFHLDASQETYDHGTEMTGGWADRSGNGRTFTEEGTTELVADGRYRLSSEGAGLKAVSFLSGSDRFSRAEAGLMPATCTFVVAMLMNAATPAANQFVFDTDADSATSRHFLQWLSTGALLMGADGGGGSITTATGITANGQRLIVTGTFGSGAGASRLLANEATVTGTIGASSSSSPMRIGSRFDASAAFLTPVDMFEFAVFTTALSAGNQDGVHRYMRWKYAGVSY